MAKAKKKYARVSHTGHSHPNTAHFKAKCRVHMIETGQPLDMTPDPARTRGSRAAATRRKNAALAEQAEVVDTLLDLTDPEKGKTEARKILDARTPARTSLGRFTRNTLEEWDRLLSHIEGAETFLFENGIELREARLTTTFGEHTMVATFDGTEWTVEAEK